MLDSLGQLAVDGMSMGLVYVILSAGFVFIMSVTGIFYIAYGQFYMIGAFITWAIVSLWKLPFFLGLLMSMAITGALGVLSYLSIFQYTTLSKQRFLTTITAALGLMMILGQAGVIMFGTATRSIPTLISGTLSGAGVHITLDKLLIIVVSVAVTLLLFWFYEKTRIGRAMRAVSFVPEAASLQGMNTKGICMSSVGIGTALAGFAGGIIAPSYAVHSEMGSNIILSVLLIAMLGGMDSLLGAVLAGLVVGLLLSFGQFFVGGLVQLLLFLAVGIIMFFKPNGLLGRGKEFGV